MDGENNLQRIAVIERVASIQTDVHAHTPETDEQSKHRKEQRVLNAYLVFAMGLLLLFIVYFLIGFS
jgi:hypothetical protein